MAGSHTSKVAGQSESDGATPGVLDSDRPSSVREIVVPDWLRSVTVTAFAPYTGYVYSPVGADRIVILRANVMRVGLAIGITDLVGINAAVSAGVSGMPAGHIVMRIFNNEARAGMLADLFSLVTAEWYLDVPSACTVSVTEYVRPQ